MGLEDILAPAKWLDEQILAQYTRAAVELEERNLNKYGVAAGLTCGGFVAVALIYQFTEPHLETEPFRPEYLLGGVFGGIDGLLWGHDILYSVYKMQHKVLQVLGDLAEDAFDYYSRKVQRVARFPVLATGIFFLSSGGYSLYEKGVSYELLLTSGVVFGLATLASSMYLKDSNPTLLERKPILERAYDRFVQFFGRRAALPDAA